MQTEQIEVLNETVERIYSEVKALDPLVIDQTHSGRVVNFLKYPVVQIKRIQ